MFIIEVKVGGVVILKCVVPWGVSNVLAYLTLKYTPVQLHYCMSICITCTFTFGTSKYI